MCQQQQYGISNGFTVNIDHVLYIYIYIYIYKPLSLCCSIINAVYLDSKENVR